MRTGDSTRRETGKAPRGAYLRMAASTAAGAALAGGAASLTRPEAPWMAFAVFALCMLPSLAALSWLIFVSGYTTQREAHAEESVENRWYDQATAGAFHDFITAGGIMLVVLSMFKLEIAGSTLLLWTLILLAADTAVRYQVLKRRGMA